MSLTRPILYSTVAFDATQEHIFTFNVIGGDQVVKNQLTIINQNTNTIVYQQTQTTYLYKHILPANTLTNGEYYSAYIITYNASDDTSSESASIQFYCYSLPLFSLSNIPSTGVISNSSYSFEVTYDQIEGEPLNSYTFNLYDAQNSLLATSGIKYTSDSTIPLTISYTFYGLNNQTTYYVQATGQTLQGTQIITSLARFFVQYVTPNVFSLMELSNNCKEGYISIKSNLISIEGKSNPDPPIYVEIDGDSAVDLRGEDSYALWDSGFVINGDFTSSLWGTNFNENSVIIEMSDGETTLQVTYRKNEDGLFYSELKVIYQTIMYYLYSSPIEIEENDKVQIWFRRINGLYEVGLYKI